MKCDKKNILERLKRKAQASPCRYSVAAIGIDHRGNIIGIKHNSQRFPRYGGGVHAEMALMKSCPKSLKTILLIRVNNSGDICPMHPCKRCAKTAEKRGITIKPVSEYI